jgi:type IV pilus assembly protein PilP
MANIRNQPPIAIEPAPDFVPAETFIYAAQQLKSPFLPNSLATELKIMELEKEWKQYPVIRFDMSRGGIRMV